MKMETVIWYKITIFKIYFVFKFGIVKETIEKTKKRTGTNIQKHESKTKSEIEQKAQLEKRKSEPTTNNEQRR